MHFSAFGIIYLSIFPLSNVSLLWVFGGIKKQFWASCGAGGGGGSHLGGIWQKKSEMETRGSLPSIQLETCLTESFIRGSTSLYNT